MKFCVGIHCFVSIPASCHSILLCSVRCSRKRTWLLRNHPMVVPPFRPLTRLRILPHFSRRYISQGILLPPASMDCFSYRMSIDSPNGIKCRISPYSHPSSDSQQSTSYQLSDLNCSRSSVMHTQRLSRGSPLSSRLERRSSADRLLTQMMSSASSFNRTSYLHYRWHTTWQLNGGWIH